MSFTTVNGVTIHYERSGVEDGTTLVFSNSLGSTLHIWDAVVPHFSDHYTIMRYDKRGHGLSDCPPGPYSVGDHGADLVALLDFLKVEKAIVIGLSVGGQIALQLALAHPQRVSGLVLCDTGAKIGNLQFWQDRINALQQNGLEAMSSAILARWFTPAFAQQQPAEYSGYRNMLIRTPLAGYLATCEALRDADLREHVQKIQAPTLVLCGAEDLATPPDLGRQLAEIMPNARFVLIEQAAHLASIEQPTALAAEIKQFLKESD